MHVKNTRLAVMTSIPNPVLLVNDTFSEYPSQLALFFLPALAQCASDLCEDLSAAKHDRSRPGCQPVGRQPGALRGHLQVIPLHNDPLHCAIENTSAGFVAPICQSSHPQTVHVAKKGIHRVEH